MQDKEKAKNCVMSEGRSFGRLLGIDHRFQVPLILNEVGGIFYVPLAQMGEHSTFNRGVMGSSPIWSIAAWILISNSRR